MKALKEVINDIVGIAILIFIGAFAGGAEYNGLMGDHTGEFCLVTLMVIGGYFVTRKKKTPKNQGYPPIQENIK